MSTRWRILDEDRDRHARAYVGGLDQVFAAEGTLVSADPLSRTLRVQKAGTGYYLKRYHSAGSGIRRYLGRSKINREWRNLLFLENLGIPGARIVAYGEQRYLGIYRRGALVTEEIPDAINLEAVLASMPQVLGQTPWRRRVSDRLAAIVRQLHDACFTHGDLHCRNVLVTTDSYTEVYLIDCPGGRRWLWPFISGRIVKDLANLDVHARDKIRRTERLRFFMYYRRISRLAETDKRMIRKIINYNRIRDDRRVAAFGGRQTAKA